jgi:hypothetical protein
MRRNPAKRAYNSPKLVVFGTVAEFTKGAISGNIDGNGTLQNAGQGQGSDRALKENIAAIGTHPLGFGLYLFDYKPEFQATKGTGRQFGVMADEVAAIVPEAVSRASDGYLYVDYDMIGVKRH